MLKPIPYIPTISNGERKYADRILTVVTENLGSVDTTEEAIRDMLHDPALTEAVAYEINDYRATVLNNERIQALKSNRRVIWSLITVTLVLNAIAFIWPRR